MMLVLGYEQRYQDIDVEEISQNRVLRRVTLFKLVYVLDRENWCTRAWSKDRYAPVEADICFRYSSKQGFHEIIHFLARLVGEIFETALKRRVEDNGGGRHTYNL